MPIENVRIEILNALKDLEEDKFDEFRSVLTDPGREPRFRIRACEVERKTRTDITKLLVSRCGEAGALDRTIETLRDIGCNDEALKLESRNKPQSKKKSSSESEPGPAPELLCDRSRNLSEYLPASSDTKSAMSAKDIIRSNKTTIYSILSGDYKLILNKIHENKIITDREYRNLKEIPHKNVEGHIVDMVDKLMDKGNETCHRFLNLLESDDEIKDTFPGLKCVQLSHTGRTSAPVQETCVMDNKDDEGPRCKKPKPQDEAYLVESNPRGICLILNNKNFKYSKMRRGTEKDAESLAEVLSDLGFRVLMCEDQTKEEMSEVLTCFSTLSNISELQQLGLKEWFGGSFEALQQPLQHGDVFICCVLSHGNKGVVLGTDEDSLAIKDITRTFKASKDSPLTGKPKVFLIQACQGVCVQRGVIEKDLETDAGSPLSIPEEADVLIAIATVEYYSAFRHPLYGSWFIQSLCQQLKDGCSRGDDIHSILQRVNSEVSQKEGSYLPGQKKQMPEIRYTLTKKLMLSPLNA